MSCKANGKNESYNRNEAILELSPEMFSVKFLELPRMEAAMERVEEEQIQAETITENQYWS
jgi:hypothetical protein